MQIELVIQEGGHSIALQGGLENRRDKQVQQDAVKAHGLRSVRSVCGKAWEEVQAFTETEA